MRKHKNRTQSAIMLEFMEKYTDIAKGFTKMDKQLVDSLWQELSESLNSAGPLTKDVTGWKKIWTDWKSDTKQKLARNKSEDRATGGGHYSKCALTQMDECVIRICGMGEAVEGVSGYSLGCDEEYLISNDDDMPSSSAKRPRLERPEMQTSNAKPRSQVQTPNAKVSLSERITKFIQWDKEWKEDIQLKMAAMMQSQQEGNELLVNAIHNLTGEYIVGLQPETRM